MTESSRLCIECVVKGVQVFAIYNINHHSANNIFEFPCPRIKHYRDCQLCTPARRRPRVLQDEAPGAAMQGAGHALNRDVLQRLIGGAKDRRVHFLMPRVGRVERRTSPVPVHHFRLTF